MVWPHRTFGALPHFLKQFCVSRLMRPSGVACPARICRIVSKARRISREPLAAQRGPVQTVMAYLEGALLNPGIRFISAVITAGETCIARAACAWSESGIYGVTPSYIANGLTMDFIELNRLEGAMLDLYDRLTNESEGRRMFIWNFGMKGGGL